MKYILPTWVNAWEGETTADCCKWERVKCNTTTGRVIQLSLNSVENHWKLRDWYLNASMFLPFEELESLDLSYNGFAGWLENGGYEKLGELTSLKSLNLSTNSLKGTIHINGKTDLKGMNNLEQLDISQNSFDGFVTHSGFDRLSVLGKLKLLDLSVNSFNNDIVPSLGFLSSLITLSLRMNNLNGLVDIGDYNTKRVKFPKVEMSQQQSKLKPGSIAGIAVRDLAGIEILPMIFLYVYQLKKKKKQFDKSEPNNNNREKKETHRNLVVRELSKFRRGDNWWWWWCCGGGGGERKGIDDDGGREGIGIGDIVESFGVCVGFEWVEYSVQGGGKMGIRWVEHSERDERDLG
ncbi:hypothetical protein HYC85_011364 [Camellia sinensis]|uniref:Leucine-rich repeat-containing N-terminal plant-type domain-containing protein n=1 Tax=Camellia sinensis TaxID=4442 RepID=A0A7J7HAU1_CAMSI|nr:hypothetical protein HYC85_011364 [Camellia sinensis]